MKTEATTRPTSELIRELAAKPLSKPLPRAELRLGAWISGALLSVGAGVSLFGVRADAMDVLVSPAFVVQCVFILALAIMSATSAFLLSVPGRTEASSAARVLPWISLFLWLGALGWFAFSNLGRGEPLAAGLGFRCVRDAAVLGVLPGVLLFFMLKRARPVSLGLSGAFALLAVGALAALGTQFVCVNDNVLHLLVWHFLPVLLLGALGVYLGRRLLRW